MNAPLPSGATYLWRCDGCGKWSHARKMPKGHERILVDAQPADIAATGLVVVSSDPGYTSEYDSMPPTVTVRCGPFEPWLTIPCRVPVPTEKED